MKVFGDMSLEGLSLLAQGEATGGEAPNVSGRLLDTDGDGRNDLFLFDGDANGTVDAVVRGLDMNGDGLNDTYVTYSEDGSVRSIGQVNRAGELEVVYEEPGLIDQLLADLGLLDLPSPEEALFTSFDDPYIESAFGSFGDDVPEVLPDVVVASASEVVDVSEDEFEQLSAGATVLDDGAGTNMAAETDDSSDEVSETDAVQGEVGDAATSEILEVGDAGDGWLYARVDVDGDGVADRTDDLQRTVDGWEADVDKDGLKETVAFDVDRDGRVESVDKSGTGDWAGSTQAWEVVEQPSDLVDEGLYDGSADVTAEAGDVSGAWTADSDAASDHDADADSYDSYDSGGEASSVDSSSGSSDYEPSGGDAGGGGADET